MTSLMKYLDYLFLTRPVLMPPVWTILLLGYHRASPFSTYDYSLALVFLLMSFSTGAVYILNQIHDIESDRINKKLFFLAEGYISLKNAWVEIVILILTGIIGAFMVSFQLGILFIIGFLFGFLYSTPPFSLKNRHIWGLLANASGHGSLTFLIGWCITANLSLKAFLFSLPYFFAVAAVYLDTTLPDIQGDIKVKKITLGVKLGIPQATWLSVVFILSSLFLALIVKDRAFTVAGVLCFPFFLSAALTKKTKQVILSNKMAVLFLTLAAAFFYPWYFIILFFGFLGTRVYYRTRFNMTYPTIF